MKPNSGLLNILTVAIVLLLIVASLAGIIYAGETYRTEEMISNFVANDMANLLIALPFLLLSLLLVHSRPKLGVLMWPAALFYVAYVYLPYVTGAGVSLLLFLHLAIFVLSVYTVIGVLLNINYSSLDSKDFNFVPHKAAAAILVILGLFVTLYQINSITKAINVKTLSDLSELGLWLADFTLAAPCLFISAWLLWQKKASGFIFGGNMLLTYGILSVGAVTLLVIKSIITKTAFDAPSAIVLGFMTIVCLVPYFYFLRSARH